MPGLFDPFRLRGLTLRNRIGVAPMCQFSSPDGSATDWHLVHLGARAAGGAGLVLTEACAVTREGRISAEDLGLWDNDQIEPLARVARFVKEQGAAFGVQLAHSGRKGSRTAAWGRGDDHRERGLSHDEGGWPLRGPSALPFQDGFPTPQAMTIEDIAAVAGAFQDAARRALTAGVDVIEVHAAHGYLVSSFNSPLSNTRSDAYGGEFDRRTRFARELAVAIRKVWPQDRPLFFRLSATDWRDDGWTVEDSIALARLLRLDGVDLIDCSSGGVAPATIPVGAEYQVPLARAVKYGSDLPTAAVGLIADPIAANAIIERGDADLILIGRESLRDPYWPQRAAVALGATSQASIPIQYATAWRKTGFQHRPALAPSKPTVAS